MLAAAAAREQALGGEPPPHGTDISATDTLDQIVNKIIYNEVRALEDSKAGLDIEMLGRAVDACCEDPEVDMLLDEEAVEGAVHETEWAEVLF